MSVAMQSRFLDEMEMGDIEDLETFGGITYQALSSGTNIPMRALTVLVWIVKRRGDPAFTLEDARRVKFAQVTTILDPTSAVAEPIEKLRPEKVEKRTAKSAA